MALKRKHISLNVSVCRTHSPQFSQHKRNISSSSCEWRRPHLQITLLVFLCSVLYPSSPSSFYSVPHPYLCGSPVMILESVIIFKTFLIKIKTNTYLKRPYAKHYDSCTLCSKINTDHSCNGVLLIPTLLNTGNINVSLFVLLHNLSFISLWSFHPLLRNFMQGNRHLLSKFWLYGSSQHQCHDN